MFSGFNVRKRSICSGNAQGYVSLDFRDDLRDSPRRRSDELRADHQRTLAQRPCGPGLDISLRGDVLGIVQLSVRGVEAFFDQIGHLQSTNNHGLPLLPKNDIVLHRLLHGRSKEVADQRGVVDAANRFCVATRSLDHLTHGGLRDAEGDQVAEGVIEQLEHALVLQLLRVERLLGVEVDGLRRVQFSYSSGLQSGHTDGVQQHHKGLPRRHGFGETSLLDEKRQEEGPDESVHVRVQIRRFQPVLQWENGNGSTRKRTPAGRRTGTWWACARMNWV